MERNQLDTLSKKILKATKWSTFTEIISKLITPVTNMILARIISPEEFGVVATITMIISFADMFTDAGFQKYIVQHEFKNEENKLISINVAFWTNLIISLIIWIIIILFSEKISVFVGSPGLGNVIAITCVQLPITSFSSIQMSIYRREFDFKTLFLVRLIGIFTPLLITIPLALNEFGYWSLIIGSTLGLTFNAIILTIKSSWKPKFIYSIDVLKEMISFSIWSLIEAISIWFTVWIDTFIIGMYLNQYYLGLYKNSTAMVNSIMSIISSSIIPILFSALSRLQNDECKFKEIYYKLQRYVAFFTFPMGVGIVLYRELVTKLLLGNNWGEAADIIGIWSLTTIIVIVFSNFNSEVYRAKGKPKISFVYQVINIIFLVPTCIISLNHGFWTFVYSRSLIRIQTLITGFIIMKICMKFSITDMIKNNIKPMLCSIFMGLIGIWIKRYCNGIFSELLSIVLLIFIYFGSVLLVAKEDIKSMIIYIKEKH